MRGLGPAGLIPVGHVESVDNGLGGVFRFFHLKCDILASIICGLKTACP